MRTLKWILVLAIPVLWTAVARPQERSVPERTTIELLLLRQKSVQQELKVSPALAKKVAEFTHKQREAFGEALNLGVEQRRQKLMELAKENKQFLDDNLTPAQRKRLFAITLQVTGLHELNRSEVATALKLTEEQQQKFKELQQQHRKELAAIFQTKERESRNEKLGKLREDTRNKIRAILTDEQKAKVRELVGEPFRGEIVLEEDESGSKGKANK
jgi:Spy/CpxP family protein refolding chaperone